MDVIDKSILGGAKRKCPRPRGFIEWRPQKKTQVLLKQVDTILDEYRKHLPLTVRQIFYRMVGKYGYLKTENAAANLNEMLIDARRARVIDMDNIRDDGFVKNEPFSYSSPEAFKRGVSHDAENYRLDRTEGQPKKLILWCEAAGMVPQLARVARKYGVPVYSSGGFDSLTAKHDFAEECGFEERPVEVLHIGDLDPSGVHMPLALAEDVEAFAEDFGGEVTFRRLAVNPKQVQALRLPSAPPKRTDRRAFKGQTTQAEAIAPDELARIVDKAIKSNTELKIYNNLLVREESERAKLIKDIERL